MISRIRLETGLLDSLKAILPFPPRPSEKFSLQLKSFFSCKEVLFFGSGRAAIFFLLKALPQKKVFIPAYTCVVVKEAVLFAGKQCIELDINPETFSFDSKILEKKIEKDSIVLATHQFGIPCDIHAIKKVCEKNNCLLLEDSAAAFGTRIGTKPAGTFGSASILSFDYTKTLTCARGGAIVFNDISLYEKVLKSVPALKNDSLGSFIKRFFFVSFYNFFASPPVYSIFTLPLLTKNSLFADKGRVSRQLSPEYNKKFSDFQARLGLVQLSRIKRTIEKRKKLALFFHGQLSKIENLWIPKKESLENSVLIRFPIIVPSSDKIFFYEACRAEGLDLGFSFSYSLAEKEKAPNAFFAGEKVLDIPFYSSLSANEMKKIVETVKKASLKSDLNGLVALATNNPKKQRISFLLEEKQNGKTIGAAGIVSRRGLPFFFLAVKPGFQGKGIGSSLVKKFFEEKNPDFIFLSVSNKAAEHIYLKNGFRIIGKKGKSIFMVYEKKKTFASMASVFFVSLFLKK
ncbi:MAG: GNAT family N-acetyltransferase [Candidatus ainarchaeum sp.]|nr:GNAT family N-acetyltransferase [Candidatus ainarchaeum sp.]